MLSWKYFICQAGSYALLSLFAAPSLLYGGEEPPTASLAEQFQFLSKEDMQKQAQLAPKQFSAPPGYAPAPKIRGSRTESTKDAKSSEPAAEDPAPPISDEEVRQLSAKLRKKLQDVSTASSEHIQKLSDLYARGALLEQAGQHELAGNFYSEAATIAGLPDPLREMFYFKAASMQFFVGNLAEADTNLQKIRTPQILRTHAEILTTLANSNDPNVPEEIRMKVRSFAEFYMQSTNKAAASAQK